MLGDVPFARRCERSELVVEAAERAFGGLKFRFEELFVVANLGELAFRLLELGLHLGGRLRGGDELGFCGCEFALLLGGDAGALVELLLRCGEFHRGFRQQLLGVARAGGEN